MMSFKTLRSREELIREAADVLGVDVDRLPETIRKLQKEIRGLDKEL